MAKQAAKKAGVNKAWMVGRDGYVTEEASSTTYIVKDKVVITRQLSIAILAGITRRTRNALMQKRNLSLVEHPFRPEKAYEADEAFITSASSFVMPIVEIDGHHIGDSRPGSVTRELRKMYIETALNNSI